MYELRFPFPIRAPLALVKPNAIAGELVDLIRYPNSKSISRRSNADYLAHAKPKRAAYVRTGTYFQYRENVHACVNNQNKK